MEGSSHFSLRSQAFSKECSSPHFGRNLIITVASQLTREAPGSEGIPDGEVLMSVRTSGKVWLPRRYTNKYSRRIAWVTSGFKASEDGGKEPGRGKEVLGLGSSVDHERKERENAWGWVTGAL